jgi:hypothetical protein
MIGMAGGSGPEDSARGQEGRGLALTVGGGCCGSWTGRVLALPAVAGWVSCVLCLSNFKNV